MQDFRAVDGGCMFRIQSRIGVKHLRRWSASMYPSDVRITVALAFKILRMGRSLWRRSGSDRPSGSIERRDTSSRASAVMRGLAKEIAMDASRLDDLSYPSDSRRVLSVFHRASVESQ